MLRIRSMRPIDIAIAVVGALVLVLALALGVSMYMQRRQVVESTPVNRAIQSLVAEVRKYPNNIVLRMNLAQTLSAAGRDREAIEQYEAVLKSNEDYAPALAGLGFVAMKNKDWSIGEQYYRRIIELREGQVDPTKDAALETAYFYLGTALMEQGEYEEAASNFTNALRIRRDASDTHYALAVCFREMDNPRKYKQSLQNALVFDPTMPEANYDYGNVMLEAGDDASAAEHFRIAADAAPKDERPPKALKQFGDAEEHFSAAKKLAATSVKKALVEARIAVALDPRVKDKLMFLASLYEKDHNKKMAGQVYQIVLTVDPLDKDAQSGLERVQ